MKNQFYADKERLGKEADRLEQLLFLVTERGGEEDYGGLLTTIRESMENKSSSPCADELLGTRNPYFDPEEFAANRQPINPGGPPHATRASFEIEGP